MHMRVVHVAYNIVELVLSSLVEKFVFSSGPPIAWEMPIIARPTVAASGDTSTQLPITISLA